MGQTIAKLKIVAAGEDRNVLGPLSDALRGAECETQLVPNGRFALELIASGGPVDLVVLTYPLPDMDLADFLAELRPDTANADAMPVVVLAVEDGCEEPTLSQYPNSRTYSSDLPIEDLVASLVPLAERGLRVMANLVVKLSLDKGDRWALRLTQSVNISKSGMLLRTKEDFPHDARAEFEFMVPGDNHAIAGRAQVVRIADPAKEELRGIAIRFRSFRGSDQLRYQKFLAHVLSAAYLKRAEAPGRIQEARVSGLRSPRGASG